MESKENTKFIVKSPLKPLNRYLRVARYLGGFPLEATDQDCCHFVLSKVSFVGCAAMFFICILIFPQGHYILYRYGITPVDLVAVIKLEGLTITDVMVEYFAGSFNSCAIMVCIWMYYKKAEMLNDLCTSFRDTKHIEFTNEELNKPLSDHWYILFLGFCMTLLSAVGINVAMSYIFVSMDIDIPGLILMNLGLSMNWVVWFFPVIIMVSHFMVVQIITLIAMSFEKYRRNVLINKELDVSNEVCFHLLTLISKAEAALGPMVLLEFISCIITTVFGIFFMTTAFGAFSMNGDVKVFALGFGSAVCLVAVLSIIRIYCLFITGQRLVTQCKNAQSALEDVVKTRADEMTHGQTLKVNILMRRLSTHGVFRPMDVFSMQLSSGASLVGLMVTYIVILVQFRTTELT